MEISGNCSGMDPVAAALEHARLAAEALHPLRGTERVKVEKALELIRDAISELGAAQRG